MVISFTCTRSSGVLSWRRAAELGLLFSLLSVQAACLFSATHSRMQGRHRGAWFNDWLRVRYKKHLLYFPNVLFVNGTKYLEMGRRCIDVRSLVRNLQCFYKKLRIMANITPLVLGFYLVHGHTEPRVTASLSKPTENIYYS